VQTNHANHLNHLNIINHADDTIHSPFQTVKLTKYQKIIKSKTLAKPRPRISDEECNLHTFENEENGIFICVFMCVCL
jgi:hypothetical protein